MEKFKTTIIYEPWVYDIDILIDCDKFNFSFGKYEVDDDHGGHDVYNFKINGEYVYKIPFELFWLRQCALDIAFETKHPEFYTHNETYFCKKDKKKFYFYVSEIIKIIQTKEFNFVNTQGKKIEVN